MIILLPESYIDLYRFHVFQLLHFDRFSLYGLHFLKLLIPEAFLSFWGRRAIPSSKTWRDAAFNGSCLTDGSWDRVIIEMSLPIKFCNCCFGVVVEECNLLNFSFALFVFLWASLCSIFLVMLWKQRRELCLQCMHAALMTLLGSQPQAFDRAGQNFWIDHSKSIRSITKPEVYLSTQNHDSSSAIYIRLDKIYVSLGVASLIAQTIEKLFPGFQHSFWKQPFCHEGSLGTGSWRYILAVTAGTQSTWSLHTRKLAWINRDWHLQMIWFLKRDTVMFHAIFGGCTSVFHYFSLPWLWGTFCLARIHETDWNGFHQWYRRPWLRVTTCFSPGRAGFWGCDHAAFTVETSAILKLQHGQSRFSHTPGLRHVAASRIVTCNIL